MHQTPDVVRHGYSGGRRTTGAAAPAGRPGSRRGALRPQAFGRGLHLDAAPRLEEEDPGRRRGRGAGQLSWSGLPPRGAESGFLQAGVAGSHFSVAGPVSTGPGNHLRGHHPARTGPGREIRTGRRGVGAGNEGAWNADYRHQPQSQARPGPENRRRAGHAGEIR